MNDQTTQGYGAVAATTDTGWITISFVLIAIGMVAALLVLIWGTRLAIRRRHARAELAERGELTAASTTPAPVAEPVATPPAAPEALADEPIAAAAPLAASPASLAADTNAAPAPAAQTGSDDLTRLKGVGPKLAARLGELGITRFAQLAALDTDQAAALDAQLGNFQGRMTRDRWLEQARFLAAGDQAGYEAVFGKL